MNNYKLQCKYTLTPTKSARFDLASRETDPDVTKRGATVQRHYNTECKPGTERRPGKYVKGVFVPAPHVDVSRYEVDDTYQSRMILRPTLSQVMPKRANMIRPTVRI